MPELVPADRVQETSTTTGTGTLNLAGAVAQFRTFVAGVGTGNECTYLIEDADGASWEVGNGTVTDASPDTLSRDTILSNDNGDTSAITLSAGTHTVSLVNSARSVQIPKGFIQFDDPNYMTYDAAAVTDLDIAAGQGIVDGRFRTWSAINLATLTLVSGGGLMYVYLFDSGGSITAEVVTTAPAWDAGLGYWIKTGADTRRCIGWVLVWEPPTSGTERIMPFTATWDGARGIQIFYQLDTDGTDNAGPLRLVALGSQTSSQGPTQFDFTPASGPVTSGDVVPEAMITHWSCFLIVQYATTTGDGWGLVGPVQDSIANPTGSAHTVPVRQAQGTNGATGFIYPGLYNVPYGNGDPYYYLGVAGGTMGLYIDLAGAQAYI